MAWKQCFLVCSPSGNVARKQCFLVCQQFLKTYYLNNIIFSLPVAVAMAPIRKAGIAIKIQPNEAENDRYLACLEVLQASTLWKYTCQGMPPNI
jgi:hypothetical protein